MLAAYCAIEHTGGPAIAFTGGRVDATDASAAIAPGRLPGAEAGLAPKPSRCPVAHGGGGAGCPVAHGGGGAPSVSASPNKFDDGADDDVDELGRVKGWERLAAHMRTVFYRMGLSDREIVALISGGHLYGRCHPEHSGYAGPWVEEMTTWSNEYAADLLGDRWVLVTSDTPIGPLTCPDEEVRPAPGKRQYVSLGPPDKFERVHDTALDDYPPGQYVVSEGEEWINARATADASSPIVAQPEEGTTYTIVATARDPRGATDPAQANSIRGRVDAGGWVSLISGGAYPLLQRAPGPLAPRAGSYRVVAPKGAPLRRAAADAGTPTRATVPAGAVLNVLEAVAVAAPGGGGGAVDVFGRCAVADVTAVCIGDAGAVIADDGCLWLTISCAADGGVLCDRVEPGYLVNNDGDGVAADPTSVTEAVALKEDDPPIKQMMLVSDMVLLWDEGFKEHLEVPPARADDDVSR